MVSFKKKKTGKGNSIPTDKSHSGPAEEPHAKRFPPIAQIKEIKSFNDLPIAKKGRAALMIDDFNHTNLKLYVREHHNAKMKCEIVSNADLKGKALKVHYQLGLSPDEFRSTDISRKFIISEGVQDWSAYKHLNFAIKVKKSTSLLRVCIVEEDGDWWNFVNSEVLDGDKWYWVKVPLKKMYLLEAFSIKGDGKQNLNKVAEIRYLFDSTNLGYNLIDNIVYLAKVFLSK